MAQMGDGSGAAGPSGPDADDSDDDDDGPPPLEDPSK